MGKRTLNPNVKTYSGKELTGFLIGLAGQNIIYNIIGSGLTYYFQNVIFIPAMACSIIFAIARVWDAFNDPMMGNIVDKTKSKWGKCKPYLLFVPAIVMVTTILPFINSQYSSSLSTGSKVLIIGWAGFSYVLWGMSYTAGDIPLWGVTSLMTEDSNDRAKILALARIVSSAGMIGMLVQFLAASLDGVFEARGITDTATQRQYSVITLAVVLTIFATILFQFAGFSVKEKVKPQVEKRYTIKENFQIMWNCKPFRQILISGILRSPIQLLSLAAMTLVTYFYFDNGDVIQAVAPDGVPNVTLIVQVLLLVVGIFGGMLVSSAFTPKLCSKFEKKKIYNIYSLIGAIPFALVYIAYKIFDEKLLTSIPATVVIALIFFAASWAMGGLNVLQSVMIADCVDYEEYHHSVRPDGVFFSGQSFITKLSAGIASIIQGIIFAAVGFSGDNVKAVNAILKANEESGHDIVHFASLTNSHGTKYAAAFFFLVAIPPAIGMLLSAIPTWKYALPNKEHKKILETLVERRRANEADDTETVEAE